MQIEVPAELFERLQIRVAAAKATSEADVIRQALDSLEWQERERQAIQEGIDAWRAGDVRSFDEFEAEFQAQKKVRADS